MQSWPWSTYVVISAGVLLGGLAANLPWVMRWRSQTFWSVVLALSVTAIALPALYSNLYTDPDFTANTLINRFLGGVTSGTMGPRLTRWWNSYWDNRFQR